MFRLLVVIVVVCALLNHAVAFSVPKHKLDISSWEEVEVQETNLRAEAMPAPLKGFVIFTLTTDSMCMSNPRMQMSMPLDRCIPDELDATDQKFMKGTLLPNMKVRLQGFKDSSCHMKGRPAKFRNFNSNCNPTGDGDGSSFRLWYSPEAPSYPSSYTITHHGNNQCNGKNHVASIYAPGCYPGDTSRSVYVDCAMGFVGYNTPDCTGESTFVQAPLAWNTSQCERSGPYFQKSGCSSREIVAL